MGQQPQQFLPLCHRVKEAAPRIGVSERTLWKLVKEGHIDSFTPPGLKIRMISEEALRQFAAGLQKKSIARKGVAAS